MTAVWVLLAVVAAGYVLSRATAMPAARGVAVSVRLAEARRIAAGPVPRTAPRTGPRSRVVRCGQRTANSAR